jgi:hypothetical protein
LIEAFCCPKEGNATEEYEDAWCARRLAAADRHRVAIADGATESSFSRLWAGLLVERWARDDATGPEFFDRLEGVRRLWRLRVGRRSLPWYAAAAFLGLELDAATRAWRAIAVGDCCIFQLDCVRPEMRLVHAFPMTRSAEFGSGPYLVGSDLAGNLDIRTHIRTSSGALRDGDVLLAATDALSAWLLWREEEGRPVWKWLTAGFNGQSWFAALADKARGDGVRNDDMTLVRITFQG